MESCEQAPSSSYEPCSLKRRARVVGGVLGAAERSEPSRSGPAALLAPAAAGSSPRGWGETQWAKTSCVLRLLVRASGSCDMNEARLHVR